MRQIKKKPCLLINNNIVLYIKILLQVLLGGALFFKFFSRTYTTQSPQIIYTSMSLVKTALNCCLKMPDSPDRIIRAWDQKGRGDHDCASFIPTICLSSAFPRGGLLASTQVVSLTFGPAPK